jgi:hypothetical protein
MYPYKSETPWYTERREGNVKTQAEIRVVCPQANEWPPLIESSKWTDSS